MYFICIRRTTIIVYLIVHVAVQYRCYIDYTGYMLLCLYIFAHAVLVLMAMLTVVSTGMS